MTNVKQLTLQTLFEPLPTSVEDSHQLIAASAFRMMEEFVRLCEVWRRYGDEETQVAAETAITCLEGEPVGTTIDRFSSPIFRGWISRLMQIGLENYQSERFCELGRELNNCFFSPLCHNEFSGQFAVIGGYLYFWDARCALKVASERTVSVQVGNERLLVCSHDGRLLFEGAIKERSVVPKDRNGAIQFSEPVAYLPKTDVVIRNDLPPLRLLTTDSSERDQCVVLDAYDPSEETYGNFDVSGFLKAAETLREAWPSEYADLAALLHAVVPRDVPSHWKKHGWTARGMTVSSHQGAVWLYVRNWDDIYEHLVHEMSHVKLRYIEESFPILADEQTSERFCVGWRSDKRPIIGIYEGVYVHLHCMLAMRAAVDRGVVSGEDASLLELRFADIRDKVEEGIKVLDQHATFTPDGKVFLEWARHRLSDQTII
jgi:HEXXH motif-containing protein